MYHYVEYVKDLDDIVKIKLDILPHVFESQIKTLHDNNFKTYFVKDIPEIINSNIIPSKKSVVLTFDDGYEDFYTVVYPILKKYQMKATVYVIYDYIGWKGFMNESQIKEIASSNLVEIGSHTLDHVYLKSVVKDLAEKQIKNSKVLLEQMFGFPVYTFAFPYGAFSQESLDIVKEAGYTAAVSVISGSEQSETNLFYLSRLRPGIFNSRFASQIVNTK
ncbi:MAG: Polysaccharide deacetylase [Candidatus Roizmanbacteria bacterium GW2011_GWA2_36_23]|uniref:Polysaccharide deacetylase n=1 Tax=Candidatus Roizmanbacteria bacterium GW2011_GWA2_36_23 TaxID=1618480 RepID=A0A0G0GNN7_9BACT|nr:MAG: Polysaccharide deacetylase [Candidatus Roizmanbacteria bacterium GW2011_GWA2_36_23]